MAALGHHTIHARATSNLCGRYWRNFEFELRASVCKSLRNLVGASGFEPPTSWSRTWNSSNYNNLRLVMPNHTEQRFHGLAIFLR